MTHNARQRIDRRFINIRNAEGSRVQFVARAHGTDNRRTRFVCLHDQFQLAGNGVNRIHDIIVLRKIKLMRGIRHIKRLICIDLDILIDVVQTLRRHIHLVFSNRAAQGNNLTVDIGQTNLVIVNQVNGADTAARQCFHGKSSDTANTEHGNASVCQSIHSVLSQ